MGAMVAGIDNHIDETAVHLLKNAITQSDHQLTETENRSLNAYMLWLLNSRATSMAGLKTQLESINIGERAVISQLLISIALADGKVNPTKIKLLEKLYSALGLAKLMVSSDIHNRSSNIAARTTLEKKTAFSLDRDLLKVHETETEHVKAVLESIFVEESVISESERESITKAPPSAGTISSLDKKHRSLYQQLITKKEWSLDEVKKLCAELQLMVDGAIEVINDWAFDNVDAPLIEDGDAVFIDLELAAEIAIL